MIPLERNPVYDQVVRDVAEVLGVQPNTVLLWAGRGMLQRAILTLREPDVDALAGGAAAGEAAAA